jgi:uncharacterized protein with GYD domain
MATYVALASLTDQGIRSMKDLAQRLQNADETFANFGATLREVYMLMGSYDYLVVADAPDDETIARVALAVAGQGNVKTQTFRAFDRNEMLRIVQGLP